MMPAITPDAAALADAASITLIGLSTADAIAIGTIAASLVTAFLGARRGAEARSSKPPDPTLAMIGTAIVDRETLQDLTEAVRDGVRELRLQRERVDRQSQEELSDKLDHLLRTVQARDARSGEPDPPPKPHDPR
jgi:hypothetical protein